MRQHLCKQLHAHRAPRETFCRAANLAGAADVVDLGEHAMKGVTARVGVYSRAVYLDGLPGRRLTRQPPMVLFHWRICVVS